MTFSGTAVTFAPMSIRNLITAAICGWMAFVPVTLFCEERIDASDPTKIYTFMGGGPKYNEYTNGEHMWEARVLGNIAQGEHVSLLFEVGYGWHPGTHNPRRNHGVTNSRLRWFHLWDMN